VSIYK